MTPKMRIHDGQERYLTEREVSSMTGLAVSTLQNWRNLGTGPRYTKPGGKVVRYPLSAIIDFMEGSEA